MQGSDGNFYGTTSAGGTYGIGTVFRITPSGALTTLHSFTGSDGANPEAALVQSADGSFYGTTNAGGPSGHGNGYGTVFRITPTGVLTTIHSFAGSDGFSPQASLIQGSDGNLYGTTSAGGDKGIGTVFKITPGGD